MTDGGGDNNQHPADLTGERIADRFVVQGRIAHGAHGVVWRAVQEPLGRLVALKVLRRDAADPHAEQRLLREGEAIAALRHPNVVVVHDVGRTAHGDLFVAMEHVAGPSLRALLERGPLPWRDAVQVALGACRGLGAAHAAGIIHRDLKPENLLLVAAPTGALTAEAVRVVDFGLARIGDGTRPQDAGASASAVLRGTPAYMSPEQASGQSGDTRSDLYALGVVLYELLTGANPFHAETALKTLLRHAEGPRPPPLSTFALAPAALDALVAALLSIDPHNRPQSARDVELQLDAVLNDAVLHEAGPRAPAAQRHRNGRNGWRLAALGGAAVAAAAIAWFVRPAGEPRAMPDVAIADAGVALVVDARAATDAGGAREDAGAAGTAPVSRPAGTPPDPPSAGPRAVPGGADAGIPAAAQPGALTLPRKIEHLRTRCFEVTDCAEPLVRRYERAVAGDLMQLKSVRADVDACISACATR